MAKAAATPDTGELPSPSGGSPGAYTPAAGNTQNRRRQQAADTVRRLMETAAVQDGGTERVRHVSTRPEQETLRQLTGARSRQAEAQADRTVAAGTEELRRAEEDAQAGFDAQRAQIRAEELRALDNQALYAEARGDRGGIGREQYGAIQSAAASGMRDLNAEQRKLATDTARQIADLRSEGEFKKADALLDISQDYLTGLLELRQWAKEKNLSVDEFNAELAKREAEYRLKVRQLALDTELDAAKLTGYFSDGTQAK